MFSVPWGLQQHQKTPYHFAPQTGLVPEPYFGLSPIQNCHHYELLNKWIKGAWPSEIYAAYKTQKKTHQECIFRRGGGKRQSNHSGFSDKMLVSLGPLKPANLISMIAIGKFSKIYLLPSDMDICQGLWGVWNFLLTRIYAHIYIPRLRGMSECLGHLIHVPRSHLLSYLYKIVGGRSGQYFRFLHINIS